MKYYNLHRGAEAMLLPGADIPAGLADLAVRSVAALGLRLCAADIVIDAQGTAKVLEINSHFSLDHFADSSASARLFVLDFYDLVIGRLFGLR